MALKISNDDQRWIDGGKDDDAKAARKAAIINLLEINGTKFDAGIGKSYIPEKNFYQIVLDPKVSDNVNNVASQAMNWNALGRGIGGLAGAGVRAGIAREIAKDRECTIHEDLTPEIEAIVNDYINFMQGKKDIFPFWAAQAYNVLGLAAAIFNREMHHWNHENTKPQQALIAALNQQDSIPDGEFRKLFYLSIHPVPLGNLEKTRVSIVEGKIAGINDSVATRCRSAPAGAGDVHACAQAIGDVKSEAFYSEFGGTLKAEIDLVSNLNVDLINHAGSYHAFAANYGLKRLSIERSKFKRAMICLCAYIFVHVKGSLSSSAALRKFKNANARMIQKWMAAFEVAAQDDTPTLKALAAD